MRPVWRAKLPVAETTCSQVISPLSVTTFHSPERRALDRGDDGLTVDLGAAIARAARERLGEIGGLDIAVLGMPDGAEKAVGLAERPDLAHLPRRQEFDLDAADRRGDAGVIFVFVQPVLRARETDVGDLAQADVEPGLGARASCRARPNICGSARPNRKG